jgi:phosphate transport system protein
MSTDGNHILTKFQNALNTIREDVALMANLTTSHLDMAIRGLMSRDSDVCAAVIAEDEQIDHLEMKVDKEGMQTMMLYSPVASDLRELLATIKIAANIERIADLAVGIAKRVRKMNNNEEVQEVTLLEPLYQMVSTLLKDSLVAFTEGNLDIAMAIKPRDKEIDALHKDLTKKLTNRMEENAAHIKDYLDLIFIVRFLERIGDHAKNIAEETVFALTATDIRHGGDASVMQA